MTGTLSISSEEHVYAKIEELGRMIASIPPVHARLARNLEQFPKQLLPLAQSAPPFLNVPSDQLPQALDLVLSVVIVEQDPAWLHVVSAGLLAGLSATSSKENTLAAGTYEQCLVVLRDRGKIDELVDYPNMLNLIAGTAHQPSRIMHRDRQISEIRAQAALWRVCPSLLPLVCPYRSNPDGEDGYDHLASLAAMLGDEWDTSPIIRSRIYTNQQDVMDFVQASLSHVPWTSSTCASLATIIGWMAEENLPLPRLNQNQLNAFLELTKDNNQDMVRFGLSAATRATLRSLVRADPAPSAPRSRM